MALKAGARSIIFSGPGKTDGELSAAVDNADRVILMIDSFGELERLDRITRKRGIRVRAGVRLTTQPGGLWGRFGIPLEDLGEFLEKADRYPFIILEGLQFHTSWNLNPQAQVDFIGRLGNALARLPGYLLFDMAFIDIGGGYWPEHGEWLRAGGTPAGRLRSMLAPDRQDVHSSYLLESTRIEEFAARIGAALDESLPDDIDCRFFIEPGRWLCHQNMHILMTAVDIKGEGTVITDAGTGAVGWERFEHDYFPLVNLSDPGTRERKCGVFGPLCTPHDVWGWSYFGEGIKRGDLILVPAQGAYTYSLRQEFIKPLPGKAVVAGPLELRWTE
jgi:diaminopimelate decarboxylase